MNNFQREGSISNAHVGQEFEERIRNNFVQKQGINVKSKYALDIGINRKKAHEFDSIISAKEGNIVYFKDEINSNMPIRVDYVSNDTIEPKIMDLRINNMKTEYSLGHLQIIGENQKIEIQGTRIFIGRLVTNDIQLTNRSISRRHCLIEVIDKDVYIVDLDSKFGTYLNDIKLSARERTLLRNNDEIAIGKGIEKVKIMYIN